jgi:hypothetical protein
MASTGWLGARRSARLATGEHVRSSPQRRRLARLLDQSPILTGTQSDVIENSGVHRLLDAAGDGSTPGARKKLVQSSRHASGPLRSARPLVLPLASTHASADRIADGIGRQSGGIRPVPALLNDKEEEKCHAVDCAAPSLPALP